MDKEIWKDIPFDNNYKVSNCGRLFSKRKNKILKGELTGKGYIRVALTKHKRYLVHCIVAKTFIPNPENKPQVNHIDGNKQNNNLIKRWECMSTASQTLKISQGDMIRVCKGKRKTCGGYIWKYEEE